MVTKAKEIRGLLNLLAVKQVCAELGRTDLLATWAGVRQNSEVTYDQGIVLQRLGTGHLAMRLDVKIQNRLAWNAVEKGVSATAARNGADPHFEYVRFGGVVLIRCYGEEYHGNDFAFEVVRAMAATGAASYGLMTKVRNKRSINHPRVLVISNSADENAVQAVVDNLGSKRRVVSDLGALDDRTAAVGTAPTSAADAVPSENAVPMPDFDTTWSDPLWSSLREDFLDYCATKLYMHCEVSFLVAVAKFETDGRTVEAAGEVIDEFLHQNAPQKIDAGAAVVEQMRAHLLEHHDVPAGFFTSIVDELMPHFRAKYEQLYQYATTIESTR
ncbi:hypothetical protein AB0M48_38755 [Lentzea sp. NPDC051208]|uniref:hypothetical protein n=1 Tax=Lentzea sp. NPDC051208 TaxID=3154642 RepID=UPI003415CB90